MSPFGSSAESSWACAAHGACRGLRGPQPLCWDPPIFCRFSFQYRRNPEKLCAGSGFLWKLLKRRIASPATIKVLFSCGGKQRFWLEKVFPSWPLLVAALRGGKAFCDVPRYGSQGGEMGLITQRRYKRLERARLSPAARAGGEGPDPAPRVGASFSAFGTYPSSSPWIGGRRKVGRRGTPPLSDVRFGRWNPWVIWDGFTAHHLPDGDRRGDAPSSQSSFGDVLLYPEPTLPPMFYWGGPLLTKHPSGSGLTPSACDSGKFWSPKWDLPGSLQPH